MESKGLNKPEKYPEICHERKQWVIAVVHSARAYTEDIFDERWGWWLDGLPGVDELTRKEGYHGVHLKDLFINVMKTYNEKKRQLWAPAEDASIVKKEKSGYKLQFTEGIRSPGLVPMLLCRDIEKFKQIADDITGKAHGYPVFDEMGKKD